MGISVLSKFNGQDRESLRISEGGKRVQIGVPSNVTIAHNLNTSSQIDTTGNMYILSPNTISATLDSDLIKSGKMDGMFGTLAVRQIWQRVGKVVQVSIFVSTGTSFQLNSIQNIPIPIGNFTNLSGNFYSSNLSGTTTYTGVINQHPTTNFIKFQKNSISPFTSESANEIYGSYSYELL
jgi:hypothetical protein